MEKYFNPISTVVGCVGGCLVNFLGGWDLMLEALLTLVVLDYITGLLKAISTKTLSSRVGLRGLIKKIFILILIATAYVIQHVIGDTIPLREIVIMFFICNEGISLLENSSEFVPIPDKLKETLIQLREKNS